MLLQDLEQDEITRLESKNQNMLMKDKLDLFKIVKYQCKGSEGFKTLGNQHTYKWYIPIL